MRDFKIIITVVAVAMLGSGCYGAKLVKGPINSDIARQHTDSLVVSQAELLREVAALRAEVAAEREARVRAEAEMAFTLESLDESIQILTSQMNDQTQQLFNRLRRERMEQRQRALTDTTAADSTTSGAVIPDESSDQVFDAAYMDLQRGNYRLAVEGFTSYLARFPNGTRLDEVHYYLGESYYAEDRFLESVGEFRYVAREYPDSRLVPSAYLKAGECYRELGENSLALRMYRDLIAKHPTSEQAQLARAALEEMGG